MYVNIDKSDYQYIQSCNHFLFIQLNNSNCILDINSFALFSIIIWIVYLTPLWPSDPSRNIISILYHARGLFLSVPVCLCTGARSIVNARRISVASTGQCLVLSNSRFIYIFFVIERLVVISAQVVCHDLDKLAEHSRVLLFFPETIYHTFLLVKCHV